MKTAVFPDVLRKPVVTAMIALAAAACAFAALAFPASAEAAPVPKVSKTYVETIDDSSIAVAWRKVSGASKYAIRYNVAGSSKKAKTVYVKKSSTSKIVKKLDPDTKYIFKVRAGKVSKRTGKISWGKWSASRSDVTDKVSLDKVTKVHATAVGNSSVEVEWQRVSGASRYSIRYSRAFTGSSSDIVSTDGDVSSMVVDNLKSGTEYWFQVRAGKTSYSGKTSWGDWSSARYAKTDGYSCAITYRGLSVPWGGSSADSTVLPFSESDGLWVPTDGYDGDKTGDTGDYCFKGWYFDSACTQRATLSSVAALKASDEDVTLYAKWGSHDYMEKKLYRSVLFPAYIVKYCLPYDYNTNTAFADFGVKESVTGGISELIVVDRRPSDKETKWFAGDSFDEEKGWKYDGATCTWYQIDLDGYNTSRTNNLSCGYFPMTYEVCSTCSHIGDQLSELPPDCKVDNIAVSYETNQIITFSNGGAKRTYSKGVYAYVNKEWGF